MAEGAHMRNCVASRIPQLLTGGAALYHGEATGKPLTIQIAPAMTGYRVVEAKTFANEKPIAAQMRVLREFIGQFRAEGAKVRMYGHEGIEFRGQRSKPKQQTGGGIEHEPAERREDRAARA
jgi:hypothetical protein